MDKKTNFIKILKTIRSCESLSQLETAFNMYCLYVQKYGISEHIDRIYAQKKAELNKPKYNQVFEQVFKQFNFV